MNTSKYTFQNGQIINLASLKPIPADEPVFILRAQDIAALHTMQTYRTFCETDAQCAAIDDLTTRMTNWRMDNHLILKVADNHEPGSQITSIKIKNVNEFSEIDVPVVSGVGHQYFKLWESGYIFAYQDFSGKMEILAYPPEGRLRICESCRNAPEAVAAVVDRMIRQLASDIAEATSVPA